MTRNRILGLAALLCLLAGGRPHAAEPSLLIRGARVFDGTGAPPRRADVLLRGDRIAAVEDAIAPPAGARVIDAEGLALLPGLFDVHTHLSASSLGDQPGDWAKNLKAYLYRGVTSVADFGTYPETFAPMRRLLHDGVVEGPRVSLAARITTPGGHGAEAGRGDLYSLEVLTPREGAAAVERVLPYHPDAIKVFTDGWRYGTAPDMTSMEEATLAAIVQAAHRAHLPVLTHTVTLEKAKIAARAGVDVIAHGIGNAPADAELEQLIRASGTLYAPTLAVYESKPGSAAPSAARARRWQFLMENTRRMRGAGVIFASGTDAGMPGTHHGYASVHELELLVQGGLTPVEALTAATEHSARALRVDAERGTIAVGKLADLVLVEGEPWTRIEDVERVRSVFLGGREVDREKLRREMAAPGPTLLPAAEARVLLDDFESPDGRSRVDTLWINSTDAGHDHSRMAFTRTLRAPGNHALSVIARMSQKEHPYARVSLPLTPGGVVPADAGRYRGIVCEVRGEGEFRLLVTVAGREGGPWSAGFRAGGKWTRVRIPLASLRQSGRGGGGGQPWPGGELQGHLQMLSFELARPAGETAWLELDNVRFYP